jgi:mono/diheme cytochrome c family protein
MDELTCEDDVLRAFVMALLVAYYRVRPSDTRFEKAALAALPPAHRAMASAQLSQIIKLTKTLARQAESERRRERDRDASAAPGRCAACHGGGRKGRRVGAGGRG